MMLFEKEALARNPITRSYELGSDKDEDTRLYDCQQEDKALGMALTARLVAFHQALSEATTPQPETTYQSDFGEDTLIIRESVAVVPLGQRRQPRKRKQPGLYCRRLFGRLPLAAAKRLLSRRSRGRSTPNQPKAPAITQFYKGVVEAVHEGLAYLTLETRNGQRLQIEWDEAELLQKNIGERQPFILKTITKGNRLEYEFIPDRFHPLSGDLQREIDDLKRHYQATGELDDDDE